MTTGSMIDTIICTIMYYYHSWMVI